MSASLGSFSQKVGRKYFEREGAPKQSLTYFSCPVDLEQRNLSEPIPITVFQEDPKIKSEMMEQEMEELCYILSPDTEENCQDENRWDSWGDQYF